jgi:transposase
VEKEHFIITKKLALTLRGESPRERLLHRLHAVVLVLSGKSALEIGKLFTDSPRAISYWVTRFKARGIAGLEEEARPGRPSKLSDSQMKQVQTFVRKMNAKSQPLNSEALSSYLLNQFKVALTPRQCWRILKRLNA